MIWFQPPLVFRDAIDTFTGEDGVLAQVKRLEMARRQALSQADQSQADARQIRDFICPISRQIMVDPVTAEDGRNYERGAIARWIAQHTRNAKPLESPMVASGGKSRPPMGPRLVENNSLKDSIQKVPPLPFGTFYGTWSPELHLQLLAYLQLALCLLETSRPRMGGRGVSLTMRAAFSPAPSSIWRGLSSQVGPQHLSARHSKPRLSHLAS